MYECSAFQGDAGEVGPPGENGTTGPQGPTGERVHIAVHVTFICVLCPAYSVMTSLSVSLFLMICHSYMYSFSQQ